MVSKTLTVLLLLTVAISQSYADYDENLAVLLSRLSGMAYCAPEDLQNHSCGDQCNYLTSNGWSTVYSKVFPTIDASLGMSVFSNSQTMQMVISFRGTQGSTQLVQELLLSNGIQYGLQSVDTDVLVDDFFYISYKYIERNTLVSIIQSAKNAGYSFIFTGHSLGGAITVLAAFDMVNSGLIQDVQVYTYGCPRVGNSAFADLYDSLIPESYRVVHYKDTVPHVPPCVCDAQDDCIKYADGGTFLWFPWHTGTEVFYDNEAMTLGSEELCEEEDHTCSNKYHTFQTNVNDHLYYFGIRISCQINQ